MQPTSRQLIEVVRCRQGAGLANSKLHTLYVALGALDKTDAHTFRQDVGTCGHFNKLRAVLLILRI